MLREITETESDTISYKFKPTRKQFRKFGNQNGFKDEDYLVKIKN